MTDIAIPTNVPREDSPSNIWWHGTSTPDTFDAGDVVYLTDRADEAYGYAHAIHKLGVPAAASTQILKITVRGGRTMDIAAALDEAMANDEDPDDYISAAIPQARTAGYRYLFCRHPSNVTGRDEQNVLISLYPTQDLAR